MASISILVLMTARASTVVRAAGVVHRTDLIRMPWFQ
jgi:hypothetical protein